MNTTSGAIVLAAALLLGEPAAEAAPDGGGDSLTIPFRLEHSRIIIPSSVNDSRPLALILDTGMPIEGAYLFHEEFVSEIDTARAAVVRVPGAGAGEASTALMVEDGVIACGGYTVTGQRIIVSRSAHTQGFGSDGVIGRSLFGRHTLEVDFDREVIILHDTAVAAADSSWYAVPVTASNELPFLQGEIETVPGEVVPVTVYVDLASRDALELLMRPGQRWTMPDSAESSYLGTGLSGDISGYRGRVAKLRIGPYELSDVAAVFAPAEVRSKQKKADGILGCGLVMRFNVIFDLAHGVLYLKPSRHYGEPFR